MHTSCVRGGVIAALFLAIFFGFAASTQTAQAQDALPDLRVEVVADNEALTTGQSTTFTVTITNIGLAGEDDVEVTTTVPFGLAVTNATADQGSVGPDGRGWTVGSLGVEAMATLSLEVESFLPGTLEVQSTISARAGGRGNDSDSSNDSDVFPLLVTNDPDIALAPPMATPNPVEEGGVVALDTPVSDAQDRMLGASWRQRCPDVAGSFDDDQILSPDWTAPMPIPGHLTCELAVLVRPAGQEAGAGRLVAVAVEPAGGGAPEGTDLSLAMSASAPETPLAGMISFTITIANNGPLAESGPTVEIPIPPILTPAGNDGGGDFTIGERNTGLWTPGMIASGESRDLTLDFTLAGLGPVDLSAMITARGTAEDAPGDETANAETLGVLAAEIAAAPLNVDTTAMPLPDVALDVVSTENGLPSGLSFSWSQACSVTTDGDGAFDDTGIKAPTWSPPGLDGLMTTSGFCALHVDITPASGIGAQRLSETIAIYNGEFFQVTDFAVGLSASEAQPVLGDTVDFTVTIQNLGPTAATSVNVALPLPAGLMHTANAPSAGSYDPSSGNWSVGALPVGADATLSLTAQANLAGFKEVTASLALTDIVDRDQLLAGSGAPTNNAATVTLDVVEDEDLSVGPPQIMPNPVMSGGIADISVSASDAQMRPLSFDWVADCPALGGDGVFADAGAQSTTWTAPTNTTGTNEDCSLTVTVTADGGGSAQANAMATVESETGVDTEITVTADKATALVGDTVTFEIMATNNGPGDIGNATVAVTLGPDLMYQSHAGEGTFILPETWITDAIPAGASTSFNVIAAILASGELSASASLSGTDVGVERVSSNDSDDATVLVANQVTIEDVIVTPPVVPSGALAETAVQASNLEGAPMTYQWRADCPTNDDAMALAPLLNSDGAFVDPTLQTAQWFAPENATNLNRSCEVEVTVSTADGASATSDPLRFLVGAATDPAPAEPPRLRTALSPAGRAAETGGAPVTAFGLVLNRQVTKPGDAINCTMTIDPDFMGGFSYLLHDPLAEGGTGALVPPRSAAFPLAGVPVLDGMGSPSVGGLQMMLLVLDSDSDIAPREFQLSPVCDNWAFGDTPSISGLNTFLFSAASPAPLDLIASNTVLTPAPDNSLFLRVDGLNGQGRVLARAANLTAAPAEVTLSPSTVPLAGGAPLDLALSVCELQEGMPPGPLSCLAPPTPTVTTMLPALGGGFARFLVLANGQGTAIARNPEAHRIFLFYQDSTMTERTLDSLAVEVVPQLGDPAKRE